MDTVAFRKGVFCMMYVEYWQCHFYIVASVTMVILAIACIVYIVDKIVKSFRALGKDCANEILLAARMEADHQE